MEPGIGNTAYYIGYQKNKGISKLHLQALGEGRWSYGQQDNVVS
jgi:hypothetical protein